MPGLIYKNTVSATFDKTLERFSSKNQTHPKRSKPEFLKKSRVPHRKVRPATKTRGRRNTNPMLFFCVWISRTRIVVPDSELFCGVGFLEKQASFFGVKISQKTAGLIFVLRPPVSWVRTALTTHWESTGGQIYVFLLTPWCHYRNLTDDPCRPIRIHRDC